MAGPMILPYKSLPHRDSYRGLFFIPASLAFMTSLFILYYAYSTTKLLIHQERSDFHSEFMKPPLQASSNHTTSKLSIIKISLPKPTKESSVLEIIQSSSHTITRVHISAPPMDAGGGGGEALSQSQKEYPIGPTDNINPKDSNNNNKNVKTDIYHDRDIFMENYKEMNRSLKIYVYPHKRSDPFANVLLPDASEPGGNYASEGYFKKALMKSHFITKNPSEADFFFLPFSIVSMRHDRRIGVGGIPNFVRDYVFNVSRDYPYWNRSGGADHFYVACHSIGKIAMDKAVEVKINAIQVVCTSNYFVNGYVAHKDVPLPQIWPRQGEPPSVEPSKRKRLAFFAGAANSPVRQQLVRAWKNDSEIIAHAGRLKTPYASELLKSRYCFHVKGFEVNTARIGDALYHGCVPVILADHYDLPFDDVIDWQSFSVVVAMADIPAMKRVLKGIGFEEYVKLQRNVLEVRRHFQWHSLPVEYDAFFITMYELWLRRGFVRVPGL